MKLLRVVFGPTRTSANTHKVTRACAHTHRDARMRARTHTYMRAARISRGCCACSDLLRGLLPAVTKETEDQKTALAKKAEAAAKGGKK